MCSNCLFVPYFFVSKISERKYLMPPDERHKRDIRLINIQRWNLQHTIGLMYILFLEYDCEILSHSLDNRDRNFDNKQQNSQGTNMITLDCK